MGRKPFYAEGIRFECQGSGKCCTSRGTYGYVYLTDKDVKRFADHFELTRAQFLKKYTRLHNGHVALNDPVESTEERSKLDCIFLEGGNRCGAYEGRPEQCRTWPFWPENMTAKSWAKEVASYCPGVGKGKLYTYEEIKEIVESQEVLE